MESSKKASPQQVNTSGGTNTPIDNKSGTSTQQSSHKPDSATPQPEEKKSSAEEGGTNLTDHAVEAYGQTKKAVSQAYKKTSKVAGNSYNQAMTYGRQNPGKFALIALGAGIAIGLFLVKGSSSRSRTGKIIGPAVGALAKIATEILL